MNFSKILSPYTCVQRRLAWLLTDGSSQRKMVAGLEWSLQKQLEKNLGKSVYTINYLKK
jgi:hypothetical protein